MSGGNPVLGPANYAVDWLDDRTIGGASGYIEGGLGYASNGAGHRDYQANPNQHYPAESLKAGY